MYGLRSLPRTVALANVADVTGQANTLLAWYKDPRVRVPSATVEARSGPVERFPQVLGREIGDLITFHRDPAQAPAISLGVFIDGIKHKVTANSWATTFLLTPQLPAATY